MFGLGWMIRVMLDIGALRFCRRFACAICCLLFLVAAPPSAFSQFAGGSCDRNGVPNPLGYSGCGTPGLFRIQVLDVSVCESASCVPRTVLGTQPAFFDIASVGPRSPVGTFAPAGTRMPIGTFSHAYIVLSRSVTFLGRFPVPIRGTECISIANPQLFPDGQYQGLEVAPATGTPQPMTSYYSDFAITQVRALNIYTNIQALNSERMAVTIAFSSPFTVTARTQSFSLRANFNINWRFNGYYNLNAGNGAIGCHVGLTDPEANVTVTAQ